MGTLVLTQPGFGLVPSLEALPHARAGFERGPAALASDAGAGADGDDGDGDGVVAE